MGGMKPFPFIISKPVFLFLFLQYPCFTAISETGEGAELAAARIVGLREEIARHDELYFREARPEISDGEYDSLKRRLGELESGWPELAAGLPHPVSGVGDDRLERFADVAHRVPMGSLRKAYTSGALRAFHQSVRAASGELSEPMFVIEPKIDGVAVSLLYVGGRFVRAASRGDGRTGDDLTANLLAVGGFPLQLERDVATGCPLLIPQILEVRGEVYLPVDTFSDINRRRIAAGKEPHATPRNLAAGSLRREDPGDVRKRGLKLLCFAHGAWEGPPRPSTQTAFLDRLRRWSFPVVPCRPVSGGPEALVKAAGEDLERYLSGDIPVDGIVLKVDQKAVQEAMGNGSEGPDWAIAYKPSGPEVETRLVAIEWQVGRTGVLTPVGLLEPVELGGRRVSRVSLHNPGYVKERDLRPGDRIRVELAGDVIPAVSTAEAPHRGADADPWGPPVKCPSCEARLASVGRELVCTNHACPARVTARLAYFASCIGIDGAGEATVASLVEAGLLGRFDDFLLLKQHRAEGIDLIGKAAIDRVIAGSVAIRTASLGKLIRGLGIPGIGTVTSRRLAACLDGLDGFLEEDLAAISGGCDMQKQTVQAVKAYVNEPGNREMILALLATRESSAD